MEKHFKQFKIAREQKGYTLRELSAATDIPFQRISDIENGQISLKDDYRLKIKQVLNIDFFQETELDKKILQLFDDFFQAILYGYLDTKNLEKQIDNYYENAIDSKYYYLVCVMKYVFSILKNEEKTHDEKILKDIDFDSKAFYIYKIYKAVALYKKIKLENAEKMLYEAINNSTDEKIRCIAQFFLIYVLIDEFKLHDASLLVQQTKNTYNKYGAYVREHKCDVLRAIIYSYQRRYSYAIDQYKKCIQSATSLSLPTNEIVYLYRNLALDCIMNHDYDEALKYLNYAKEYNVKNELLNIYYVYLYFFTKDVKQFKASLVLANKYITNNSLKVELEFWNYLGKTEFLVDSKTIQKALKVYQYFKKEKRYETLIFYVELIFSLFEQINDEKSEFLFIKNEKNIIKSLYNSLGQLI